MQGDSSVNREHSKDWALDVHSDLCIQTHRQDFLLICFSLSKITRRDRHAGEMPASEGKKNG